MRGYSQPIVSRTICCYWPNKYEDATVSDPESASMTLEGRLHESVHTQALQECLHKFFSPVIVSHEDTSNLKSSPSLSEDKEGDQNP